MIDLLLRIILIVSAKRPRVNRGKIAIHG